MPHHINLPAFKKQIKDWQAGLLTRSEFFALFVERLEPEDYDSYLASLPEDARDALTAEVQKWDEEPWVSRGTHEYGGLLEKESTDLQSRKEERWKAATTSLRTYLEGPRMTEQAGGHQPPTRHEST